MFGLTFHLYGLLVGIALVVGWELVQRACKKYQIPFEMIQKDLLAILFGGFIFARLWHGVTDWSLYSENPISVLYVWNGGLSIIGGIIGGGIVVFGLQLIRKQAQENKIKLTLLLLTDLMVHALPISQAIGRLGNYINQELYGLPTNVPWAIFIDPENRLQTVLEQTHFHPLFLYEIVLNTGIAVFIWCRHWRIGSGQVTAWYLVLYGLGRFLLDFLRIDKGDHVWLGISLNQYILLFIVGLGFVLLKRKNETVQKRASSL